MSMILYLIFLIAVLYFCVIKPQKTRDRKRKEMLGSLCAGTYCCTTAGFYGHIVDISSDMVIMEFGNENGRVQIPVAKAAIMSIEKEDDVKRDLSKAAKDAFED